MPAEIHWPWKNIPGLSEPATSRDTRPPSLDELRDNVEHCRHRWNHFEKLAKEARDMAEEARDQFEIARDNFVAEVEKVVEANEFYPSDGHVPPKEPTPDPA